MSNKREVNDQQQGNIDVNEQAECVQLEHWLAQRLTYKNIQKSKASNSSDPAYVKASNYITKIDARCSASTFALLMANSLRTELNKHN